MKKLSITLFALLAIILTSCSGSDSYQGKWKAVDAQGGKYEIAFSPDSFTVKDSTGKASNYKYSQNSYHYENGTEVFGIHLEDGRGYQIYFPKGGNDDLGLIKDENGVPVYTIGRKDYVRYDDFYKLN